MAEQRTQGEAEATALEEFLHPGRS
jgi:hypothetical protein